MTAREKRLTWGGKVILTLSHAAARYGKTIDSTRMALKRAELQPISPPPIDERTPTWYQSDLDAAMRHRPGKGAPGRARKRSEPGA